MRPQFISEEEFKGMQERVRGGAVPHGPKRMADCQPKRLVSRNQAVEKRAGETPAPSPYKSKWEAAYAGKLELEKRAGVIKAWKYEGLTFALAKGKYHRMDFLVWHLDGSVEIAQVKGWHKNLRAGITGLKWAAQLHPWFTWTMKRWTGTGWDSEYVEV